MNTLLPTTLLAPLAGIIALVLLPTGSRIAARIVAVFVSLTAVITSLGLAFTYDCCAGGIQFAATYNWVPSLGLSLGFGVDGLSLPLVVLAAVVGLAAVLVTGEQDRAKEFYILVLAATGAAQAAFASRNLFFFYFFCEVTTIPKYLLTAAWGRLPEGKYLRTTGYAAMQVTIYIAAGAMIALIGLIALYVTGGGLDLDALRGHAIPIEAQYAIYGALLLGFGIWSSMWPLHTWSPLTYAAAPAPAAMIFAGVMKNFGAYALLRIGLEVLPDGALAWSEPLAAIGIVNILYGGWAAMRQKDWTYIIAYSSISHIGYLLLAIAVGGTLGASAAVLSMVAHGLVVAMLFALAGMLEKGAGSRHVPELGGLARALPFVSVAMAIAVIAASGLPGFANFVAEILVFIAAWSAGTPVFRIGAIAAVWGIVITATYFFRALRSTFYGEPRGAAAPLQKPAPAAILALAILLVFSVALGVWPRLILDAARNTISKPAPAALVANQP